MDAKTGGHDTEEGGSMKSQHFRIMALAATALLAPIATLATTPSRGTVYLSTLSGSLYRLAYAYDGAATFTLMQPLHVAALPRGGGVRVLADGRVAIVGAGSVSLYDPRARTVQIASSMTNANSVAINANGSGLWVGWKDTALSSIPLAPFGNGTPHSVSGDDSVASMVAFTPGDGVFYTTGGEFESGHFGRIDMTTFVTTRIASSTFSTGIVHDAWSQTLITAGLGHARQIDPHAPEDPLSQRDDSAAGENYLVLEPTGDGHAIGTRSGAKARLVLLDYSASQRIGDPSSILVSAEIQGLSDLSGAAGFDRDLIFTDGSDPVATAF